MTKLIEPGSWRSPSRRQLLLRAVSAAAASATGLRSAEVHAQAAGMSMPPIDPSAKAKFIAAVEDYYHSYFERNPSVATSLGNHKYDHLLEDGSERQHEANKAFYHDWLDKLEKLNRELKLPPSAELNDLEALIGRIEGDILYSTEIKLWRKDPGIYPSIAHIALYYMIFWIDKSNPPMDYKSKKQRDKESKTRLGNVIARLDKIPELLKNGKKNVTAGQDPPKALVVYAQENMKTYINFFEDELPEAFPGIGYDDLYEFRMTNKVVIQALKEYSDYLGKLKEETKGPEVFAIGTAHLKEHFLYYELFEADPAKLLIAAEKLLDKELASYEEVAKQLVKEIDPALEREDPSKIVIEVDKWVKKNLHPTREELIPTARRQLTLLKQFLNDKNLVTIHTEYPPGSAASKNQRKLPLDADVVPGGDTILNSPGPLENPDPGRAIYNMPAPETKGDELEAELASAETNGLLITSAHEVWPGHFMQYLTALRQQENQSLARRLAFTVPGNATSEGWPHYAEQMVVEEGLGEWMVKHNLGGELNYLHFGQISNALLRTGRLVVGLRVQMQDITTVEDAEQYFRKKCFQTPALAKAEAVRASYYGAVDLSYTFGKMMILQLRQDYQIKKGREFSLKEFHDQLLAKGCMPLKIIRQEMMGEEDPKKLDFQHMLPKD